MQNITLICETLMLESIKHNDVPISHATVPIHDCCISFFINAVFWTLRSCVFITLWLFALGGFPHWHVQWEH